MSMEVWLRIAPALLFLLFLIFAIFRLVDTRKINRLEGELMDLRRRVARLDDPSSPEGWS